jgi:hypothetical protein
MDNERFRDLNYFIDKMNLFNFFSYRWKRFNE